MALFNVFGSKPKENVEETPIEMAETTQPENVSDNSSEKDKEEDKKRLITITWGTGMPIDVIFNFIHKNFEEDGFQDALVNQDITYRDAKERIIRNDLEMLFKRIILRYKGDIRAVDVKIDNARKALALSAASELEARRVTFEEHLNEIKDMQQKLEANAPTMTTMIESYRRGFMKGIAASTVSFINNNK